MEDDLEPRRAGDRQIVYGLDQRHLVALEDSRQDLVWTTTMLRAALDQHLPLVERILHAASLRDPAVDLLPDFVEGRDEEVVQGILGPVRRKKRTCLLPRLTEEHTVQSLLQYRLQLRELAPGVLSKLPQRFPPA